MEGKREGREEGGEGRGRGGKREGRGGEGGEKRQKIEEQQIER